jgi:HTH-type transcriptional regulator/antitoxin HigA
MPLDLIVDYVPIRSDADHKRALQKIESLWGADAGTDEGKALDVLIDLVEHYEEHTYPSEALDPVDFLRAAMDNRGASQADLAKLFGSASRASEVLNRKRRLTVDMIQRLESEWHLPASALVKPYNLAAS